MDVDVQDVMVNGTMFAQSGADLMAVAPVNEDCLWFQENPYWRLTSTTEQMKKYMCVCYNLCINQELIDTLRNFSQTNGTDFGIWQQQDLMFYLTFVMYLLMILFGTMGNIMVIVGILYVMKDKTVVNRFVVSLAVADLFMSFFITPIKLLYQLMVMKYVTWTWLCKIMLYMRQLAQTEVIVMLTIISCERYYAICHPLKAKFRCSMRRCHILIAISWFVSLIIALPTVISAQYHVDRSAGALCVLFYGNPLFLQIHFLYFMVILLLIPTFIMIFTYGRICFVLWKSAKKVSQMTNKDGKTNKTPPELKARVKVIKTMAALLLVFILSWGPRLVLNVVVVFFLDLNPTINYYADLLVELLANGHSLINPVMFIIFSQPFRAAFAKRYPGLCCCLTAQKMKTSRHPSMVSGQTTFSTDNEANGINTTYVNHM